MPHFSRCARSRALRCAASGLCVIAALLAGCAAATPTPMTANPSAGADAELQTLMRAVSEDAARRSGLDASRVRVLEAGRVTWSDGALGCPAPGRFYTQALVPGFRVQLEAGGERFDYHANARGEWSLCSAERARPPAGNSRM